MARLVKQYLVSEIPDCNFTRHQLAADGDVHEAIWKGWEILSRAVSRFPVGGVSCSLQAVFTPQPPNGDVQSRLCFIIKIESEQSAFFDEMRLLIEHGLLANYFVFRAAENHAPKAIKAPKTCHVVRRCQLIKPLHGSQFNDRIPEWYYLLHEFEPETNNDYATLDKVLNSVREPVSITIGIKPADLTHELAAHTKYLANLQSINRSWDHDDFQYDWPSAHISLQQSGYGTSNLLREIKPIRKSDPLADFVLRSQQKIHENLNHPHLAFFIRIDSSNHAVAHLVATVVAESAFSKGSYNIIQTGQAEGLPEKYSAFKRMQGLANVEELSGVFRLPVASYASPLCIKKDTDPPAQSNGDRLIMGTDSAMQAALDIVGGQASALGPSLTGCAKHGFLCGVSGSGKTTAGMNLVLQLSGQKVPVLIIEPVKTEYRLLKTLRNSEEPNARQLAESLEIYTPGNESISPFRHNCLQSFPGISVDEHIGSLMSCFMGAMPSTPFLPIILEEALENVYRDHDPVSNPPLMQELVEAVRQVISEKGYSGETLSDIKAASELRLASLTRGVIGKVFQCRQSVPSVERLVNRPTLIELDHLSSEKSSLLILFLLMAIREHLVTIPKTGRGLRLVIVLEEAHNLVGRSGPARSSEEAADPKSFVAEAICRILVEFRALEVGVIIVDQHSTAVAPEVIKATGTKVAFRQVADEDRQDLGATMLFGPLELEEIARLSTGEAFYYTEGLYGPRRMRTVNLHSEFDLSAEVTRNAILPYMRDDPWLREVAMERAAMELSRLKEAMDAYDRDWLGFARRLDQLLTANARLASEPKEAAVKQLYSLRQTARSLKRDMSARFNALSMGPFQKLLEEANPLGFKEPVVSAFRDALSVRFEKIIRPGFLEGQRLADQILNNPSLVEGSL